MTTFARRLPTPDDVAVYAVASVMCEFPSIDVSDFAASHASVAGAGLCLLRSPNSADRSALIGVGIAAQRMLGARAHVVLTPDASGLRTLADLEDKFGVEFLVLESHDDVARLRAEARLFRFGMLVPVVRSGRLFADVMDVLAENEGTATVWSEDPGATREVFCKLERAGMVGDDRAVRKFVVMSEDPERDVFGERSRKPDRSSIVKRQRV